MNTFGLLELSLKGYNKYEVLFESFQSNIIQ